MNPYEPPSHSDEQKKRSVKFSFADICFIVFAIAIIALYAIAFFVPWR